MVHILEIDLDTPGLSFVVTPGTPKDGNEFVLDIVVSGSSKQALDRADATYVAFLKAN